MTLNQYVGSSASNSHLFASIVTKRIVQDGLVIFRLFIDGECVKEKAFTAKGGRAVDPV